MLRKDEAIYEKKKKNEKKQGKKEGKTKVLESPPKPLHPKKPTEENTPPPHSPATSLNQRNETKTKEGEEETKRQTKNVFNQSPPRNRRARRSSYRAARQHGREQQAREPSRFSGFTDSRDDDDDYRQSSSAAAAGDDGAEGVYNGHSAHFATGERGVDEE